MRLIMICWQLANVLEIDLELVKNAVSMYCRLGFAKKKGTENHSTEDLHPSWKDGKPASTINNKKYVVFMHCTESHI